MYNGGCGEQVTGTQGHQEVSTGEDLGNEGKERHSELGQPSSPCSPHLVVIPRCSENKNPISIEGRHFLGQCLNHVGKEASLLVGAPRKRVTPIPGGKMKRVDVTVAHPGSSLLLAP